MHHHNSLAESIQHWFSQPSTVDWCEKNYTVTDLIAEFWNTLSSNAMVFYGIFGLLMHAHFGKRFFFLFASFTLVGIGSVLFHGTLLFPFQLLDELPMCYTGFILFYCLIEKGPKKRYGIWLPIAITLYAIFTTIVSSMHGRWQFFVFQASYLLVQIFTIGSITVYVKNSVKDAQIKTLWSYGLKMYTLAITMWLIDLNFCDFVTHILPANPQLHAWWHIFAATASYYCCFLGVKVHTDAMGLESELGWWCYIFPYIRITENIKNRLRSRSPLKTVTYRSVRIDESEDD